MITGLVAITPAAGVVAAWGAISLGLGSGTIPWISMNIAGKHLSLFRHVDDTLEVFHTHFVGALVGGIGTGLFATSAGCAAFGLTNPGGAIDGNGKQVWLQIVGALFIIGWNIVWTSLIMIFIKHVCRVPLRMSEADMAVGDFAIHGEEPYTFAHYNIKHPASDPLSLRKRWTNPRLKEAEDGKGVLVGEEPKEMHASSGEEIQPVKEEKSAGVTSGSQPIQTSST
jgi:ammonium transporter, Amt family